MNYEIKSKKEIDLYSAIPTEIQPVDGWKELPIVECHEPLVPLGSFSGNSYDRIFTSSIYFSERDDSPYPSGQDRLDGSLITTFTRESVADQLLEVEKKLPPHHHIVLLDTYRTLEVQGSLYRQYYDGLKEQHPDWPEEKLSSETQKMVSLPSTDTSRPSPHNTGGSVDLAVYKLAPEIDARVDEINERIDRIGHDESKWQEVYELEMERIKLISQNAELLEFGTEFDYGGKKAALNYFEVLEKERPLSEKEKKFQQNRRLLFNVMVSSGFQPYVDEWWHYNSSKSQMGAKTAGIDHAEYGAIELSEDDLKHELTRTQHLEGSEIFSRSSSGKLVKNAISLTVWRAARMTGDMRRTSLPEAAIIEPPKDKAA